jgi:ABC-2 type transport system permease protein
MNDSPTRSVWLVARREFNVRVRSRQALVTTASVAVLLLAFVLLQAYVVDRSTPLRVGVAGQAISLQDRLPQAMAALGTPVQVRPLDTVAQGVEQIRHGQLDVLVSGATSALRVTVDNDLDPRLRATLNGQVRQQILEAQIAQLGARPDDVLSKVDQAAITVRELHVTDPDVGRRLAVGVLTALLLAWSLLVFPVLAAGRVADDATSGTAEALLPVLRPRRLLAGDLAGTGLAGLVHVAAVGVLGTVASMLFGVVSMPSSVLVALAAGLVGFVLGFAMYGCLVAALTALATRPAEHRRVRIVLGALVLVVLVVSVAALAADPVGPASAVLSVLPPFAPVLLPGRLAVGAAAGWQVLLALVLALATATALAWFAGRVYPRSLLRA